MKKIIETLTMFDGERLKTARFETEETTEAKGVVQIIHGFGEHIDMYADLAAFLTANGYHCVIHDQRGFGEMPEKTEAKALLSRGVIADYSYFLKDAATVRSAAMLWYPELPIFLYGHSMGGNISISILRSRPDDYKKAILETPWLRLFNQPYRFVSFIANKLGKISHKLAVTSKINISDITRDLEIVNKISLDKLYHNRISLRLFSQITITGKRLLYGEVSLSTPTLILCGGQDKIVCPKAIRSFSKRAKGDIQLKDYPDGYHALRSDTIKAAVLNDVLSFLSDYPEE